MAGGRVEVISSKGCSRLFGISTSFSSLRGFQSSVPMSPASSVLSEPGVGASGPFAGLVICVTGLSKEARKQVMAATERLGGQYSPNLHPQCTHLVVQVGWEARSPGPDYIMPSLYGLEKHGKLPKEEIQAYW